VTPGERAALSVALKNPTKRPNSDFVKLPPRLMLITSAPFSMAWKIPDMMAAELHVRFTRQTFAPISVVLDVTPAISTPLATTVEATCVP